ncbi:hypothetical protein MNBD_GAMMA16-287 [hydrothermal vent metagenome]|uniref:ABM domain-containing protein n=1 Tax=hydrothermal vent metagenome TaxID=652676 RepID=A0A3B0ZE23_9ZZZZ
MQVTIVHVHVKAKYVTHFIEACRLNHESSIQEPGNFRFDILQMKDDSTRFILYEAYESATHAKAHKTTSHYLAWRETVADWMASPREGIAYQGLYPTK